MSFARNITDAGIGQEELLSNVLYSDLSKSIKLQYDITLLDAPVSHMLAVGYVPNNAENGICWACCTAAVGNFFTSKKLTGEGISKNYFNGELMGGDNDDIIACLKKFYNITFYTIKTNAVLNFFSTITDDIYTGYPVFGTMTPESGVPNYSHAIVFKGFHTNSVNKYCYLMDPNLEETQVATVTASNGIAYIRPDAGHAVYLTSAVYHKL